MESSCMIEYFLGLDLMDAAEDFIQLNQDTFLWPKIKTTGLDWAQWLLFFYFSKEL